jgi:hypothetical protein
LGRRESRRRMPVGIGPGPCEPRRMPQGRGQISEIVPSTRPGGRCRDAPRLRTSGHDARGRVRHDWCSSGDVPLHQEADRTHRPFQRRRRLLAFCGSVPRHTPFGPPRTTKTVVSPRKVCDATVRIDPGFCARPRLATMRRTDPTTCAGARRFSAQQIRPLRRYRPACPCVPGSPRTIPWRPRRGS